MSISTKATALVGYYASVMVMPNGDLAIIASHNLMDEWQEFKRSGRVFDGPKSVCLPEDQRTPRNLKLGAPARKLEIDSLLYDLCDQTGGMGEPPLYALTEWDVAAMANLTSAPMLAMGPVERNEEGHISTVGKLWAFMDYQVEDELETLLEQGVVIFPKGD